MKKRGKLYEGKAKIMYKTDNPDLYIQYFKDDATAFDGVKKGTISSKGAINCSISAYLFQLLEAEGITTHFVEQLGEREMLVKALEIVMVEVVIRNVAAGSIVKRLGFEEGFLFEDPMVELFYKSDALHDPLLNDQHVQIMKLATPEEVTSMKATSLKVNRWLKAYLLERGIRLIDYKLEFGRHHGELLLADEITPDGCRFWDSETGEKMDKDRFRFDLGQVDAFYLENHRRIVGREFQGQG